MIDLPGDAKGFISHIKRKRVGALSNEEIIERWGGSNSLWGQYLSGPRVQACVRAANARLAEHNIQLVSDGVHSKRWRIKTAVEAYWLAAEFQLKHADSRIKGAFTNVCAIVECEHSTRKQVKDAVAWIELFNAHASKKNHLIFIEWAGELTKLLPRPIKTDGK